MKTTAALTLLAFALLNAPAQADTFGSGANTFDIEFVSIGDPGNPADTTGSPNPAGQVDYAYRMGKFEVSEDMINKANALGGLGITHDNRGVDKPATSLSWNEAARFVNWLNTITGNAPAYKFEKQPGLQPEQSLPELSGTLLPAERRRVVQGGLLRSGHRCVF